MDLKGFVDAVKEFIWDIVGYLIPGFIAIILISTCANKSLFFSIPIVNFEQDFLAFTILIFSYTLGHLIYGITLLIDQTLEKRLYRISKKAIVDNIQKSAPLKISLELVKNDLISKGSKTDVNQFSTLELRNYVMSYFPENDRKVYTFMFRSELCNHIISTSLVIGGIGLISSALSVVFVPFVFKVSIEYITIYFLLILSIVPLHKAKIRFYSIAIRIPFDMFNSNYRKNEK